MYRFLDASRLHLTEEELSDSLILLRNLFTTLIKTHKIFEEKRMAVYKFTTATVSDVCNFGLNLYNSWRDFMCKL